MKQRTTVMRRESQQGIAALTSITRKGTTSHLPTHPCRYGTRVDFLFGPTYELMLFDAKHVFINGETIRLAHGRSANNLGRDIEIARHAGGQVGLGTGNTAGSSVYCAPGTGTAKGTGNANANSNGYPFLLPLTANAAAALSTTYASSITATGFTLTHANAGTTDRTFAFHFTGG